MLESHGRSFIYSAFIGLIRVYFGGIGSFHKLGSRGTASTIKAIPLASHFSGVISSSSLWWKIGVILHVRKSHALVIFDNHKTLIF